MRVILETPYQGTKKHSVEENIQYALDCVDHSLKMNEAPIAFHLIYPRVLDDTKEVEREKGLSMSQQWYKVADKVVVYVDHGISDGMRQGIDKAHFLQTPILMRSLYYEGQGNFRRGSGADWFFTGPTTR